MEQNNRIYDFNDVILETYNEYNNYLQKELSLRAELTNDRHALHEIDLESNLLAKEIYDLLTKEIETCNKNIEKALMVLEGLRKAYDPKNFEPLLNF